MKSNKMILKIFMFFTNFHWFSQIFINFHYFLAIFNRFYKFYQFPISFLHQFKEISEYDFNVFFSFEQKNLLLSTIVDNCRFPNPTHNYFYLHAKFKIWVKLLNFKLIFWISLFLIWTKSFSQYNLLIILPKLRSWTTLTKERIRI